MDKLNELHTRATLWANAHPLLFCLLVILLSILIYVGVEAAHGH